MYRLLLSAAPDAESAALTLGERLSGAWDSVVYGLSSIFNWYRFGRHNPNIHAGTQQDGDGTADVEDATDETILQHSEMIRRKMMDKHGDNVEEAEIIE